MNPETVKNYFDNPLVVADYASAAENVGLWNSERIVFEKYIPKSSKIIEFGCGAGRISLGLNALGYGNLTATDFAPKMVEAAAEIFARHNANIEAFVCDATDTQLKDASFDAAIFGFNGLMQIPKAAQRRRAIGEICRILKPGGIFAFTTHNRGAKRNAHYWENEKKQWQSNSQQPVLDDFGDIFYEGEHGNIFIHSPSREEIELALSEAGFDIVFSAARPEIAQEPELVRDFSDDCIFWCAKKRLNLEK